MRDIAMPNIDVSEAAQAIWAKSSHVDGSSMSLVHHQQDSASVASIFWQSLLPPAARNVIANCLPNGDLAPKLAVFCAAAHDVGKASSAFVGKVPHLAVRAESSGLTLTQFDPEAHNLHHGKVSAVALQSWLETVFGGTRKSSTPYAMIVGGHHGVFPTSGDLMQCSEQLTREDQGWHAVRMEFLERAQKFAALTDDEMRVIASTRISSPAQVVLTGFVIVCDWIASNEYLFPYSPQSFGPQRIQRALSKLNLPAIWEPRPPDTATELFGTRFSLPPDAAPRPVQNAAMEVARSVAEPSLILIEAPTGEGKTEAALAAAEILASRFGQGGVAVALPTCATSDAMFQRVLSWLAKCVKSDERASAILCHGKAQFNEQYEGLIASGRDAITSVIDEDVAAPNIEASWWLRQRKTSALADFTVGTIDQILFAALRTRHVMMRHCGLAGKVVVIDEIHCADEYMSVYLERTIEWLGAMGVPVVALSATLAPAVRCRLLAAYRKGKETQRRIGHRERADGSDLSSVAGDKTYPLVSAIGAGAPVSVHPGRSGRTITTHVEFIGDDAPSVVERVLAEAAGGGCIAVVCNTVVRAQNMYEALRNSGRLGTDELRLLHSRFTSNDRRLRESEVVSLLGAQGDRPARCVIVATQVIEQSLDVDFDLMFSDLAPADLVIQRIGRLHRHQGKIRPSTMTCPRLLITGVDEPSLQSPPSIASGSKAVYGEALLLRTLAVLLQHRDADGALTVSSPDDVAGLVRSTYANNFSFPPEWSEVCAAAEDQRVQVAVSMRNRAHDFLLASPDWKAADGLNQISTSEETEGQAQVRDIEESLEVVLISEGDDGSFYSLSDGGDTGLPLDLMAGVDDEVARFVARCTVNLPSRIVRGGLDALITDLERHRVDTWQRSTWLRGLLPMPLDSHRNYRHGEITFHYDNDLGLQVSHGCDE